MLFLARFFIADFSRTVVEPITSHDGRKKQDDVVMEFQLYSSKMLS